MVPYAVCGLVVVVCPAFFVPLQPRPCVFFFSSLFTTKKRDDRLETRNGHEQR